VGTNLKCKPKQGQACPCKGKTQANSVQAASLNSAYGPLIHATPHSSAGTHAFRHLPNSSNWQMQRCLKCPAVSSQHTEHTCCIDSSPLSKQAGELRCACTEKQMHAPFWHSMPREALAAMQAEPQHPRPRHTDPNRVREDLNPIQTMSARPKLKRRDIRTLRLHNNSEQSPHNQCNNSCGDMRRVRSTANLHTLAPHTYCQHDNLSVLLYAHTLCALPFSRGQG
jgi:hypothetical protein